MIARRPSYDATAETVEEPTPYIDNRERERLKKRRQRARRYDRGLKADGTPVTNEKLSLRGREHWTPKHPSDCRCYDCLFPKG